MIVLPETDAQGARSVAARCREAIAQEAIPHEKSTVARLVTISAGIGTTVPSGSEPPLAFIEAVDRCLYRAKQAGRNRTEELAL